MQWYLRPQGRSYISGVKNNRNTECPFMRSSLEVAVLVQKKLGLCAIKSSTPGHHRPNLKEKNWLNSAQNVSQIIWYLSTPAFHGLLLTKSMHWVYLSNWHGVSKPKYFYVNRPKYFYVNGPKYFYVKRPKYFYDIICCFGQVSPLVAAALYLGTIQTHISSSLN